MEKIIILGIVLSLILISGCVPLGELKICKITDIVQVSAGGYRSSDKCIYNTTCGRLNLYGQFTCRKQIGEDIRKITTSNGDILYS
jgi:hypothetical protein